MISNTQLKCKNIFECILYILLNNIIIFNLENDEEIKNQINFYQKPNKRFVFNF